ncbi:glycosyltransferase [Halococcus dombrowskii]|uniref:Glycosyltransferase n=1 Tax=Halococcus dombrowskii TaxID=179637 RepID=A0AAX3AN46_HALDO|nr:glycosyltransferase [Halococcus dombrowskii]UOO95171.1 glycosyltransferase [Halococcus dombrowskii]
MRIGVYLGTADNPTDNVAEDLGGVGRCLSDHELDAFGTASLPESVRDYYTQISTTHRSPRTPYTRILATYRDCREYIRRRSPDVLFQVWKYQTHAPGLALAGHRAGVPTITRLAGDVFQEYQGHSGVKKAGIFLLDNIFGRIPLRLSDAMIVFGPYGAAQASYRGMDSEDIVTIPPPGELDERFSPPNDKAACRRELDLPSDRDIALFVGRLSRLKGMNFLAEVIERVASERDVLFVLAGSGPHREKLAERFSDEVVRLPGYVPHAEIHRYYRAADVYVHPSPYEGIPLVLLEAMNCGVPVVSRPAGDIGFLTPNITETPAEMAATILARNWSDEWLNEKFFTTPYQAEALGRLVRSVDRSNALEKSTKEQIL